MSALTRFKPVPPALRLIRNTSAVAALERVDRLLAILGCAGERHDSRIAALASGPAPSSASMLRELREHEDRDGRLGASSRPARRTGRTSRDSRTKRAASLLTRRGSQQTWRSFISASRIVKVDAGDAAACGSCCARRCGRRRGCSRRARAACRAARRHGRSRSSRAALWRTSSLSAAQDVRRHLGAQRRRAAASSSVLLDRDAIELAKRGLVAEQARHQEVEQRPQLVEAVLDRRAASGRRGAPNRGSRTASCARER